MSITVQSISLSVTVSILPRASPTSVSVKLLTPCQQWRRAYLDPVDGWVLVDLSQANIFSESAERGAACVCQPLHPRTYAHTHVHPRSSPQARAMWCPALRHLLTPSVFSLEPNGWSSDPTATGRRKTDSRFFFFSENLDPCPLHRSIAFLCEVLTSCFLNKPVKLTLPAQPKGNM